MSGVSMAAITYDAARQAWTLATADVRYVLRRDRGLVVLQYFGVAGGPEWKDRENRQFSQFTGGAQAARPDVAVLVEGEGFSPDRFVLVSDGIRPLSSGGHELRLLFRHRSLALDLEARYVTWAETGVITREVTLTNTGTRVLRVQSIPSLFWQLPNGGYELSYLASGWGLERQLKTVRLDESQRTFVSTRGRSSAIYSPWFALRNNDLRVYYMGQLAYSGNWQMTFERQQRYGKIGGLGPVEVDLGMRFDFGGALTLDPGKSFLVPRAAFTASGGDLDDTLNRLHRYQRQHVMPALRAGSPLPTLFNPFFAYLYDMPVELMKKTADIAAEIGLEFFVLDAGWSRKENGRPIAGDWGVDSGNFPNGLEELATHVRKKGMQLGLWVEMEAARPESRVFKEHPDWFLTYQGQPFAGPAGRLYLDFAREDVRRWARGVIDRLVRDYGICYLKNDYNVEVGERFDSLQPGRQPGDRLYRHVAGLYRWLDDVRSAHPDLIIENCASGGLRLDLAMIERTHNSFVSDEVKAKPSVQLAYGCTVEFPPEVCSHWMAYACSSSLPPGMCNPISKADPGWWDFMLRVPMNGPLGISGRLLEWDPGLKERARENVALYKRIRTVIAGADVYHLTPPPAHEDPEGWTAIQYVSQDRRRSVLMAYRLRNSDARASFRLRGLAPELRYRIEDGAGSRILYGKQLAADGWSVNLDAQWRAAVIELEAAP
jgi:alpha-galactosidase